MPRPDTVSHALAHEDRADRLEARVERLEAALRPFAAFACGGDGGSGVPLAGCACHNCVAARLLPDPPETRTEGEG